MSSRIERFDAALRYLVLMALKGKEEVLPAKQQVLEIMEAVAEELRGDIFVQRERERDLQD